MFFNTCGLRSYTVVVMPSLVDCEDSNVWPCRKSGITFILAGLVRLLCRNVPPVRSTVRVFSRFSGITYLARLAGSSRFKCVKPSQPRRMPITSQSFSDPR